VFSIAFWDHVIEKGDLDKMDPLTAVSFAASILTFIDFSYQVITGTYEVMSSGATSKNAQIGTVIKDLHDHTALLGKCPQGGLSHEAALKTIASECENLSQDLLNMLERLKASSDSPKWRKVKVVIRSLWKKGAVAELESRLDRYRSQILLRLVSILKYVVTIP
jgi:hypothetical protein